MGEAYRMGLMHGQFDSMTQGERMELRVRRIVDQIMEPEYRRIEEMLIKGGSYHQVEVELPRTEADVTKRVLELMELAVTERAHEIDWGAELTPTTLRKVMQEMRKVKVPPLDPDPVRDRWLRIMLIPAGLIDQNVFARVEPTDEERHIAEALYAPRETQCMGDGIARTVIADEEHGECHRIVEQYTRISAEALEIGPLEIKVEVPVEVARAWLEAQGVTGDQ